MLTDTAQVYEGVERCSSPMWNKPNWHAPSPASCTAGAWGQLWRGRRLWTSRDISCSWMWAVARGPIASGQHCAGPTCTPLCFTWPQCVRWPRSISPAGACNRVSGPWWGICGRTRSRRLMFTSIQRFTTIGPGEMPVSHPQGGSDGSRVCREVLSRLPLAEAVLTLWRWVVDPFFLLSLFARQRGLRTRKRSALGSWCS